MSLAQRILVVLVVWAVIYLPWLGTSGLRSEEGHRVLPAVEMLESGDFLVPRIGGELYLQKPPLINWLVAASFKICGVRNEWSARLPSTLAVLVLAFAFVTLGANSLGDRGSIAAALACLSSLGVIEKGRMIEIEAVYVALFGLALLCWLRCWQERKTPWLTWTVPGIFLGLGALAKGPALLLFFYAIVFAVLWRTRRLKELFHPAHFAGLLLIAEIFGAWAIPYLRGVETQSALPVWTGEFVSRINKAEPGYRDWILNFPMALAYFMPFLLLLPFVRLARFATADRPLAGGIAWGTALPFCFVLLLPGAIPRYILPTLVPACCLFGMAMEARAFAWNLSLGRFRFDVSSRIIWTLAVVIALAAMVVFPLRSATTQRLRPGYEADAAPLNAALPPGEILYAIAPGYQPLLFYVRAPIRYLRGLDQLSPEARYVLIPATREAELLRHPPGRERAQLITTLQGLRGHHTVLYRLDPAR